LIGMLGMIELDLAVHPKSRNWRYSITEHDLQVVSPKRFAKIAREEANKGMSHISVVVCQSQPLDNLPEYTIMQIAATTTADSETKKEALIQDFPEVTEIPEVQISVKGVKQIIETMKDPPFGPIYNLSGTELASLREYLNKGLDRGWIQHSISPAGAPILFVLKKDGKLDLCVDYCTLNAATRKNRHTLPLISKILDRLNRAQYLTKIDLQDVYHRIAITKKDQWKTAFCTCYGHFEYCVMPFGPTNSPATFQAYINKALSGLMDVICVVYLDDILIYSENLEDHRRHVREVFERLRRFSLYANLKKCLFFQTEVEFLSFIVGRQGTRMDPKRVEAVTQWPQPKSVHNI
jgi:hypothetical protein